jgi:Holliday junction resolvasome RuvABC ATP-dependent DNA helicase subunit
VPLCIFFRTLFAVVARKNIKNEQQSFKSIKIHLKLSLYAHYALQTVLCRDEEKLKHKMNVEANIQTHNKHMEPAKIIASRLLKRKKNDWDIQMSRVERDFYEWAKT